MYGALMNESVKLIGSVGRLILLAGRCNANGCALKTELCSVPGDGAVGLRGIEAAEVAVRRHHLRRPASAEAAASTSTAKPAAAAKTPAAEGSAKPSAAAVSAKRPPWPAWSLPGPPCPPGPPGPHTRVEPVVRIHAGVGAYLAGLAGDGDRFVAEVGVAGDRGQRRAALAFGAGSGVGIGGERAFEAQVFGRVAGHLPHALAGGAGAGPFARSLLRLLLLLVLFGLRARPG